MTFTFSKTNGHVLKKRTNQRKCMIQKSKGKRNNSRREQRIQIETKPRKRKGDINQRHGFISPVHINPTLDPMNTNDGRQIIIQTRPKLVEKPHDLKGIQTKSEKKGKKPTVHGCHQ